MKKMKKKMKKKKMKKDKTFNTYLILKIIKHFLISIMNVKESMKILEINVPIDELTYKIIRKSYLKSSLKYHPDKRHGNKEKFGEIVKAYENLCEYNSEESFLKQDTENSFDILLEELITKYYPPKNNWTKIFIKTTIKNILNKCENLPYTIFEKLEKNRALEVFDFLEKINDYGIINKNTMDNIQKIVQEKMKNDNIILLNPSLEDVMHDKIYKLDISTNEYFVPLWHNELYFDYIENNIKSDLIVKIIPDIQKNVFIDHNNNIYYKKNIDIKELYENESVEINICNRKFKLLSSDFKITKKTQFFKYENEGILKINENDYFDNAKRSTIIFELNLVI